MPTPLRHRLVVSLTAAVLAGLVTGSVAAAAPASATDRAPGPAERRAPYSFAVIGDLPYGPTEEARFPGFVDALYAAPGLSLVAHLGDVKNGSSTCDDARLEAVRTQFDRLRDPLVYTPGDNEWTDCHRTNNGAYQPLERLDAVRDLFFPRPGRTLGGAMRVTSQAGRGYPENVRWVRADVSFATLHVVGSNNDLAPWTGIGQTTPTAAQVQEQWRRMDAAIANVHQAFAEARRHHRRAVVLMQQADMFDPTVTDPQPAAYSAFRPLVQAIVDESRRFRGPVHLFDGDSHVYRHDRPLARGSQWLDFYQVRGRADRLVRTTVDGEERGTHTYLEVTVSPRSPQVLRMERVPVS
ncbi:hypothetical protein SAMN04488570_0346 [Nocardioides scoriae]|uniref:Calcineurin-like phosphoesterase n=1 Tax=Nocardioides scoriae TaxID=642780 RepID=A0A1H1LSQ5_9ACTN|nr:hypothetical protein [Nocardioides scoriae]SDR77576.1 hypothetical protein SAMN04488570_0346 [Nocardioides scoriae]